MGGDDELTFKQNSAIRWAAFKKFMYNKEAGTVMGRNGKAWAQLLIFYTIFYLCLAAFWAAMLAVFLQTIDPNRPTWNSYVSTPAIAFAPNSKGDRIEFTLPFDNKAKANEKILKPLNAIWEALSEEEQAGLENCEGDEPGNPDGPQRFCKFDRTQLGPNCQPPNFGYDVGKPCIYVNLNKVWGWVPKNYPDGEIPEEVGDYYVENNILVRCEAEKKKYESVFDANGTDYRPNAGISFRHYPYIIGTNRTEQEMYVSPIVAIQFSIDLNAKVRLRCMPYAGNVEPLRGIYESDAPTEFLIEFYITDNRE